MKRECTLSIKMKKSKRIACKRKNDNNPQTMSEGNQHAEAMDNLFKLLTRFGYCQALLYKAWVEASSEIESTVVKKKDINNNNTEESNSLYIDTFEEKFTTLFQSPEFASNASKLLNSLVECIKQRDMLVENARKTLEK